MTCADKLKIVNSLIAKFYCIFHMQSTPFHWIAFVTCWVSQLLAWRPYCIAWVSLTTWNRSLLRSKSSNNNIIIILLLHSAQYKLWVRRSISLSKFCISISFGSDLERRRYKVILGGRRGDYCYYFHLSLCNNQLFLLSPSQAKLGFRAGNNLLC